VKDLGAGPAGQTITLMPLFGALLAASLLGEALHGFHLTGMVLILGGIVLGAIGAGLGRR
jgi:drug/metabolite transporter (DMT)-like permease